MLKDIRTIDNQELKNFLENIGEKSFRLEQIQEWLWKKQVDSFAEMSNLSKALREKLSENFTIQKIKIKTQQKSVDGTIKFGFELHDGNLVEGVLIPTHKRMTACVSSQVGCSLTCKFCATGYMKLKRNLLPHEIYEQVEIIKNQAIQNYGIPLTNIVFMGMGEPLLNYKNVISAIEKITSAKGMEMSAKRITVSTAGIAKMIKKLADDQVKFELALSLHAANDEKRNTIMPINQTNSLVNLKEALQYFYQKTKNQITLEYIVFRDFNDTLQDAKELYQFAKSFPCKINIIEYNPIAEAQFVNTSIDKLENFKKFLEEKRMIVNIRRSRGKDIDAACGQLAIKEKS
ncbi:MAG: putative dual-specificity RNA methyltransferase RlmN [Bacteroidia bacterium]|nr:MAG: putative dual-specificity RNA methyltransferase RlmN [Bacteroidia bacterium]